LDIISLSNLDALLETIIKAFSDYNILYMAGSILFDRFLAKRYNLKKM